jgi:hypothetical protein
MSDNFKANLVADNAHAPFEQQNAKLSSAKLSLCGNDQATPSAATVKPERAGGLYLIADNDIAAPAVPNETNNVSDTTNQATATDNTGDTTTKGKKTRVLQGSVEQLEENKTGDLHPGNGQQDTQEVPKPTVFYKMQAEADDTFGQQLDDKFMEKVHNKLANKISQLIEENRDRGFVIDIPQGSEIWITCELDRKGIVSKLKVEPSPNPEHANEHFNKLLLQSVNEVSGDPELCFPDSVPGSYREEDCNFDLGLVDIKHQRNGASINVSIGASSRR